MDTLSRSGMVIPKTDGSDSTNAFRLALRSIGLWTDTNALIILPEGTLASRPSASKFGRIYHATDAGLTSQVYFDNGTTWYPIGATPATDAAAGVGSLRTLGAGANQAAPGDTTAAGIAVAVSADLRDWCRAGFEVPGQTSKYTAISGSAATIAPGPASGSTTVVKSLLISAPTAGMVVTLTLAGVTLAVLPFTSAGVFFLDCMIPVVNGENLQAASAGGSGSIHAGYGVRTDLVVQRLALVNGTATAGALFTTSGAAKTVTQVWVANPTTTPSVATVTVGSSDILTTLVMPGRQLFTLDSPIVVPASTAVTYTGDGTTSLIYMLAGR